jgi:hypothetical protein
MPFGNVFTRELDLCGIGVAAKWIFALQKDARADRAHGRQVYGPRADMEKLPSALGLQGTETTLRPPVLLGHRLATWAAYSRHMYLVGTVHQAGMALAWTQRGVPVRLCERWRQMKSQPTYCSRQTAPREGTAALFGRCMYTSWILIGDGKSRATSLAGVSAEVLETSS